MPSLSDHIPNLYAQLAVNNYGQLDPDLPMQKMAKALEKDFGLKAVIEVVPQIQHVANNTYISELHSIMHKEKCYGRKTRERAFDKMLATVVQFGSEKNGDLAQDIFMALYEHRIDPEEKNNLLDDSTIGPIVDFILSRGDALNAVKSYQYHHQRMYGRSAQLRNE